MPDKKMNETGPELSKKNEDAPQEAPKSSGLFGWLRGKPKNGENSVRETLEELIDEREDSAIPLTDEERDLVSNILRLRDRTVYDVMVPSADIMAVDEQTPLAEVIKMMAEAGHSRFPVYRETLDDLIGVIHIKDMLGVERKGATPKLASLVRRLLFVSPSMQVLELLLEMRTTRLHMAIVVDEYGGTDGLVTIEDLVEEIVGEIADEHDRDIEPELSNLSDGSYVADARIDLDDFEAKTKPFVDREEFEDIDTLGGLVFALAGRVPVRGELISHPLGLEFEVLDADLRRIKRLKIRGMDKVPSLEVES